MSLDQTAANTPRSLRYRLCVMMFLQYFVQGSYLPVITEYLRSGLEFTPAQIGTFSAAIAVGPLVAPFFFGQLVDRHLATEKVLAICHLCGGVIMLALYSIEAYVPIVILGVLYSTLYVPSMMLTNSLSFHHLADREREFPLIRLWGTIGFVLPAWWVEMVFLRGLEGPQLDKARGVVLAFAGFGGLVMGLYCLTLPHTPPSKSDRKDLAPGKVLRLLRRRNFAVLVGVSLIVAIVHKHYFVWAAPFLRTVLDSVGIGAAIEGRIMSLGQVAEVAVMALLGLLLKRLGFKRVMLLGAAAYLVRCALLAWAIMIPGGEAHFAAEGWAMQFSANGPARLIFALLIIGQMLHGLCFGCFLAAAYIYVDKVSPTDVRGSMQTFYGTFIVGVGLFAGGFISGWLGAIFETLPGEATLRSAIGISSTAGLVEFTRTTAGKSATLTADWPGIWLSGGAIALVALVLFAILFPHGEDEVSQQAE